MINTLTSVLSARSKVRHLFKELLELVIAFTTFYGSKTCASGLILASECQAAGGITDKAQLLIEDIDKSDGGKELAVVDYIEDIYKFYKIAEVTANISALQNCDLLSAVSESHLPGLLQRESRPLDYIGTQVEMNSKMRAILVDWIIEVHHKFELMPETLYLAMYIIDQYLSLQPVVRRELQLLGVSALLIACKYEEIWGLEVHKKLLHLYFSVLMVGLLNICVLFQVNDFIQISAYAYSREQILSMEKGILNRLEWNLTVPTPYVFLVRFLKVASLDVKTTRR
jgi:G2/mitotic-specific cyclin-B, other